MNDSGESMERITVEDLENLVGELRMMARGLLVNEGRNHSFTPTALAMSALRRAKLKDLEWEQVQWESRTHFFCSLSEAMRHALVDHARRRKSKGRAKMVYLAPDDAVFQNLAHDADQQPDRLLQLEDAMIRLRLLESRLATVITHYYYLGHSTKEIAGILDVNEKTVDRDLQRARILLRKLFERESRD